MKLLSIKSRLNSRCFVLRFCLLLGVLAFGANATTEPSQPSLTESKRPTLGVMAFDVPNDIGIDSAAGVLASLMARHMEQTGRYQLLERPLLHKVLEERAMEQLGLLHNDDAASAGRLQGADQVVVGSAMRLGKRKIATARIVNVQTASVIAGATVEWQRPEDMESTLELLAWRLSGRSDLTLHSRRTADALKQSRGGVRIGLAYGESSMEQWSRLPGTIWEYNRREQLGLSGIPLQVFYHSRFIDVEVGGSIPRSQGGLWLQGTLWPQTHVGLTAAHRYDLITVEDGQGKAGAMFWRSSLFGMGFRISPQFRFTLLKGIAHGGDGWIRADSGPSSGPRESIEERFDFLSGPTWAQAEYRLDERWSLRMDYHHALERSFLHISQSATDRSSQRWGHGREISLSAGYGLGL